MEKLKLLLILYNCCVLFFSFSYQITGIHVEFSDDEWSINMKKALASKLHLDVSAGDLGKGPTSSYMRAVEVNDLEGGIFVYFIHLVFTNIYF